MIPKALEKLEKHALCALPDFIFKLGDDVLNLSVSGQQTFRYKFELKGSDYLKGQLEQIEETDEKVGGNKLLKKLKKKAKFISVEFCGPLPNMKQKVKLSFKGNRLVLGVDGISKHLPPKSGEDHKRFLYDIKLLGVDNGSSTKDELNFTVDETVLGSGEKAILLNVKDLKKYLNDKKDILEISFNMFDLSQK